MANEIKKIGLREKLRRRRGGEIKEKELGVMYASAKSNYNSYILI